MKKALIIILFSLCLLVTGCGGADTAQGVPQESGFDFVFKYGVTARNTLDTFHGTFTKDMVMDTAITIDLILTAEEMDSIYEKMVEIDFFSYPDKFSVDVPEGEQKTEVTPYSTYYFKVEYDSKSKELLWHDKIVNSDEKADKLKELINLIRNIIESREEYQDLPEPSGGYL
jgi:hypothetical protein